jgi:hypothetical protein
MSGRESRGLLVGLAPGRSGDFHDIMSSKTKEFHRLAGNNMGKDHPGQGVAVPFLVDSAYG